MFLLHFLDQDKDDNLAAGPSCPESRTSQESRTWEGGSHRSRVIMAGGGTLFQFFNSKVEVEERKNI